MWSDLYLSIFLLAGATFFLGFALASWYYVRKENNASDQKATKLEQD